MNARPQPDRGASTAARDAAFSLAMGILFVIGLSVCFWAESQGNPALADIGLDQAMGSMEGKEVRFGIAQSAMFTTVTTSFTTGTVNNMHDTLTPLGGMIPLLHMMLNVVFGGKGVGLMNMILYAILAVFICGLMIGRTPEYLGKKDRRPGDEAHRAVHHHPPAADPGVFRAGGGHRSRAVWRASPIRAFTA